MPDVAAAKQQLRRQILHRRDSLSPEDVAARGRRIAVRAFAELDLTGPVVAYLSWKTEPSTWPLIERLRVRGVQVVVPVVDGERLHWATFTGDTTPNRYGIPEPTAYEPLDPSILRRASALLVPGLAVDPSGLRLGRGGGFYDRVLGGHTATIVLYDDEVVPHVPAEPHDQRVDAVLTPERFTAFRSA